MSETLEQLQVRTGQNQSLFRDVNERIGELQTSWKPLAEVAFVCECADETCSSPISASREEYDAVRASPVRFLVQPEHVSPASEFVVDRNERFWVVEKVERARAVARWTAPTRD